MSNYLRIILISLISFSLSIPTSLISLAYIIHRWFSVEGAGSLAVAAALAPVLIVILIFMTISLTAFLGSLIYFVDRVLVSIKMPLVSLSTRTLLIVGLIAIDIILWVGSVTGRFF